MYTTALEIVGWFLGMLVALTIATTLVLRKGGENNESQG